MTHLIERSVAVAYSKYIAFLQAKEDENISRQERLKIATLIKCASHWKGGRYAAPQKGDIEKILRLKGQAVDSTDNKFELFQKLIMHLRQSVRGKDGYVDPIPQTPAARHLFEKPQSLVITTPAVSWITDKSNIPPVVGTRRFQSLQDFNEFMVLGQHPTNSSPCVPAAQVDWSHAMVYEEWHLHRVSVPG